MTQVVQPTDAQKAALDELKEESAKAVDLLKGACPNNLPSIPTGRLDQARDHARCGQDRAPGT